MPDVNGITEEDVGSWKTWAKVVLFRIKSLEDRLTELEVQVATLNTQLTILRTKVAMWVVVLGVGASLITTVATALLRWHLSK